ncbi:hypothetical protein BDZ45DRAFT_557874, partial [Acephala macrosclerotiorum]
KFIIPREKVLWLKQEMEGHWSRGSMTVDEFIDHFDFDCSVPTLNTAFKREGIGHFWAAEKKFLILKNMRERDEYCRTLKDGMSWILLQYKNILYSDACHFAHNMRRKKKCYRR